METTKPWYLSKTVVAALIVAICGILTLFGVGEGTAAAEEAEPIANNVIGLITAISGLIALWGRITAKKEIE
jgi:hypothetical protein